MLMRACFASVRVGSVGSRQQVSSGFVVYSSSLLLFPCASLLCSLMELDGRSSSWFVLTCASSLLNLVVY